MANYKQSCDYVDYGPKPFIADIRGETKNNTFYRDTLWTGNHLQLTLMCIPVRGEIGLEVHADTDQFLRIESGKGIASMGKEPNALDYQCVVKDGCAVFVPAGTWHNIVNTGNCPLKMYSIYAPRQHPHGTIHRTKEQADEEGH